jgi:diaminohydroxyphosphoribosylaminopyrimidine deaminase/5-amino-6-(5-phosphoribosylamino)uracil reductase
MKPTENSERALMLQALAEAEAAGRRTPPNPRVGAVLVRGGEVVARGRHEFHGGPHAEVNCIEDARAKGVDPAGCTLYVTLEPCNHQGKTPPCTKAILEAKIPRVVIGAPDPNRTVQGGGAEALEQAGVEVVTGVAERECLDLVREFLVWQNTDRPYVIVKLASTLDGRIAARSGHSRWITGEAARQEVHELRSRCGAVIVGGQTFRADNPSLDARGVEAEAQPLAVVVTSRLPRPNDNVKLLAHRAAETIFLTGMDVSVSKEADALREVGVRIWGLPVGTGGLCLAEGLARLRSECGVHRALCEGGGALALSFLTSGLMDEFWLFTAPKVLGDERAAPLFSGRSPETMDEALGLRPVRRRAVGGDMLQIFAPLEKAY